MRMLLQIAVFAFVALAFGCQSLETSTPAAPTMKQVLVDGVTRNKMEQGQRATSRSLEALSIHRIRSTLLRCRPLGRQCDQVFAG